MKIFEEYSYFCEFISKNIGSNSEIKSSDEREVGIMVVKAARTPVKGAPNESDVWI